MDTVSPHTALDSGVAGGAGAGGLALLLCAALLVRRRCRKLKKRQLYGRKRRRPLARMVIARLYPANWRAAKTKSIAQSHTMVGDKDDDNDDDFDLDEPPPGIASARLAQEAASTASAGHMAAADAYARGPVRNLNKPGSGRTRNHRSRTRV